MSNLTISGFAVSKPALARRNPAQSHQPKAVLFSGWLFHRTGNTPAPIPVSPYATEFQQAVKGIDPAERIKLEQSLTDRFKAANIPPNVNPLAWLEKAYVGMNELYHAHDNASIFRTDSIQSFRFDNSFGFCPILDMGSPAERIKKLQRSPDARSKLVSQAVGLYLATPEAPLLAKGYKGKLAYRGDTFRYFRHQPDDKATLEKVIVQLLKAEGVPEDQETTAPKKFEKNKNRAREKAVAAVAQKVDALIDQGAADFIAGKPVNTLDESGQKIRQALLNLVKPQEGYHWWEDSPAHIEGTKALVQLALHTLTKAS